MTKLIIGPSCVGKSLYIDSLIKKKIISENDVFFGTQIKKFVLKKKKTSVLHYNILHYMVVGTENFTTEKFFLQILRNKLLFEDVIILVAPIEEIFLRVKERIHSEKIRKTFSYDNNSWTEIYKKINLFKIYEDLFEILDIEKIKYKVLFSSNNLFKITDRVFVHQNLCGKYYELPNNDKR